MELGSQYNTTLGLRNEHCERNKQLNGQLNFSKTTASTSLYGLVYSYLFDEFVFYCYLKFDLNRSIVTLKASENHWKLRKVLNSRINLQKIIDFQLKLSANGHLTTEKFHCPILKKKNTLAKQNFTNSNN